jgi:hypothetical protein
MPGPLVQRKDLNTRAFTIIKHADGDLSAAGVLYQVGRKLRCHECDAPNFVLAETLLRRGLACETSRFGNAGALGNDH